jgi:hypothetical protein
MAYGLTVIAGDTLNYSVDQARMHLKLQEAQDPNTTAFEDNTEIDCILNDYLVIPSHYQPPKTPGLFWLAKIDDITETPMHLTMNAQKVVLKDHLYIHHCLFPVS